MAVAWIAAEPARLLELASRLAASALRDRPSRASITAKRAPLRRADMGQQRHQPAAGGQRAKIGIVDHASCYHRRKVYAI